MASVICTTRKIVATKRWAIDQLKTSRIGNNLADDSLRMGFFFFWLSQLCHCHSVNNVIITSTLLENTVRVALSWPSCL